MSRVTRRERAADFILRALGAEDRTSSAGITRRATARGITIWRKLGRKMGERLSEFDQLRIMQRPGIMPAPPP
jgi:hypothetical protein